LAALVTSRVRNHLFKIRGHLPAIGRQTLKTTRLAPASTHSNAF
jgi:hypothetical protein